MVISTYLVLFKKFFCNLNLVVCYSYVLTHAQDTQEIEQNVVFIVMKLVQVRCDLGRGDSIYNLPVVSN